MLINKVITLSIIVLFHISMANAEKNGQYISISEREIIESITELKVGQKAINVRIDDLKNEMNTGLKNVNVRIDDLKNEINTRINDMKNELNTGLKNVNTRIDDMNIQFNQMFTLLLWGFGILFTGIFGLIGYIIWDRMYAHDKLKKEIISINEEERFGLSDLIVEEIKQQFNRFKKTGDLPDSGLSYA